MPARAMLLATGLQESSFLYREQVGGPAHGLWQFEKNGGVKEILTSDDTVELAHTVCRQLLYTPVTLEIYNALPDNDVLACVFARLLLWRHPSSCPEADDPDKGWKMYVESWRPGAPRPHDWPQNFKTAWGTVRE